MCAQKHVSERYARKAKWKIPDLSLAPFLSHIFLREKASLWLKAVLFPDYTRREQTAAKVSLLIPMACQRAADAELIRSHPIWYNKLCISTCIISATNTHISGLQRALKALLGVKVSFTDTLFLKHCTLDLYIWSINTSKCECKWVRNLHAVIPVSIAQFWHNTGS